MLYLIDNYLIRHNWHYYDHGNFPKPLLTMTMAELHCYSPTEVRFFFFIFHFFRHLLFILCMQVIMREVRGRIRNTFRRRELMARLHLFADGPETLPQWMLACLFARIPPVSRTPPAPLSSEDITALRERTYALSMCLNACRLYTNCVLLYFRFRYGLQPRGEHAVISDYLETGELPPLFHLPDSYVRERSAFYLDIKPDTVKK